ncbi:MAG: 1-deoxy-D-xylulose-5-phosphate reductoisomerase, partial [Pseudomonadota bacterium]
GALSFRHPDHDRFPALGLAAEVVRRRGTAGAAFNAAKETALDRFLDRDIGFLDMARVVTHVLDNLNTNTVVSFDAVTRADREARALVLDWSAHHV